MTQDSLTRSIQTSNRLHNMEHNFIVYKQKTTQVSTQVKENIILCVGKNSMFMKRCLYINRKLCSRLSKKKIVFIH